MNWISYILAVLIITTITGTVSFFMWKILERILGLRFPDAVYFMLHFVCLLYVLPVGYILIQLTVRDGYLQLDGLWQMNFAANRPMGLLALITVVGWCALTIRGLWKQFKRGQGIREICRRNIPEEDDTAKEEFAKIRKELKIHRKIRLCRNDSIPSPMIIGFFRHTIILPYEKYSREQLRVIFYHELTHYKNHDMFYKFCGVCVRNIQHLNLFSEQLRKFLDEWSEYHCDSKAIESMDPECSVSKYFITIIDIMEYTRSRQEGKGIFMNLYSGENGLERRLDYMKKYKGKMLR